MIQSVDQVANHVSRYDSIPLWTRRCNDWRTWINQVEVAAGQWLQDDDVLAALETLYKPVADFHEVAHGLTIGEQAELMALAELMAERLETLYEQHPLCTPSYVQETHALLGKIRARLDRSEI
jgi:hypothetical protein